MYVKADCGAGVLTDLASPQTLKLAKARLLSLSGAAVSNVYRQLALRPDAASNCKRSW